MTYNLDTIPPKKIIARKNFEIIRRLKGERKRRSTSRVRTRGEWPGPDIAKAQLHIYLARSNIISQSKSTIIAPRGRSYLAHRGIGCLRTNVPAWRTSECACAQLHFTRDTHRQLCTRRNVRGRKRNRACERETESREKGEKDGVRARKRDASPYTYARGQAGKTTRGTLTICQRSERRLLIPRDFSRRRDGRE